MGDSGQTREQERMEKLHQLTVKLECFQQLSVNVTAVVQELIQMWLYTNFFPQKRRKYTIKTDTCHLNTM